MVVGARPTEFFLFREPRYNHLHPLTIYNLQTPMAVYFGRLCVVLTSMLVALLAGGLAMLIESKSDLQAFRSPTTGYELPPLLAFKVGTQIGAMMEAVAFRLKPPMAQIADGTRGYQSTHALGAFARLRVAEAIEATADARSDGLADVFDISRHTEPATSAEALRRLLRYLAVQGYVASNGDPSTTRFGHTAGTRLLLKEVPGSLWGMAVVQAADHADAWQHLDATLTQGPETIAFESRYGLSIFDHYAANPNYQFAFSQFMTSISQPTNAGIAASSFNFTAACGGGLVDLGGGHGSLLAEVVATHPALSGRATVVDIGAVVEAAAQRPGVRFVVGDAFEKQSLPASSNCYVLKSVLHDWSDARATSILKNVRHALSPAGDSARLLIAEVVLLSTGDAMSGMKLGLDVSMMALTGGKERSKDEWTALLLASGFEPVAFLSTPSPMTIIEARLSR